MMNFEEQVQIINDAIHVLNTGKKIVSENGTLQRGIKTINKAIKLNSIEVDMAILMLSKFFQTSDTFLDSGRVVQLLKNDDIGVHLISLLDNYFWSYNGLMKVNDFQTQTLLYKKIYTIDNHKICTGFSIDNDINSFILREYKEN